MFDCKNAASTVNRIHHAAAMWQDDRSLLNQTSMIFVWDTVLTATPVQQERDSWNSWNSKALKRVVCAEY